jgi:site-specific DNA recombinase
MGDRTALYARISEDPLGLEKGVTRQIDDGRALILSRGWSAAGEFVDNDLSALSGKRRPQYEALMAAVDAGQVDRIVAYQQSRLWRNRKERADAIERLRARRVAVICVKGPELDLSSASGRMLAGLLGEFDTHESEVKGERVARAALARAQAGQANGAPLYGWRREYETDDRGRVLAFRDVVDEEAAPVVREIVDRLLAGDGLRALAADLNRRGIPAPQGGQWAHSTVRKLALRPANVARRMTRTTCTQECPRGCTGHEVGAAAWPAIVEQDRHDRVVALLTDPARHRLAVQAIAARGTDSRRHLLTYGIGECGVCGGVLRAVNRRVRRKVARARTPDNPDGVVVDEHPLYVCDSKAGCVGRNRERVDELVDAVVAARLMRPDALDLLSPAVDGGDEQALAEVRALRQRLDDAAEDYASGLIDREQMRRITASLQPRLAAAESSLRTPTRTPLPPDLQALVGAPDVAARWEALPVTAKRALLDVLCRVVLLPTRRGAGFRPEDVQIVWEAA